jgi:hypothetical protein
MKRLPWNGLMRVSARLGGTFLQSLCSVPFVFEKRPHAPAKKGTSIASKITHCVKTNTYATKIAHLKVILDTSGPARSLKRIRDAGRWRLDFCEDPVSSVEHRFPLGNGILGYEELGLS